jgi:hypothetical protein
VVPVHQSTSCMRSTSCMLFDDEVVVSGAVVVAASTVCFGGGITGICHTAAILCACGAGSRGSFQLERRPSTLGLDHAHVCIAKRQNPLRLPLAFIHGAVVAECVCLLLQDLVQSCLHGGGGDMGGHVLLETTSRGLCGLVCPSRTSEHGGEGDCVKEGGGEEGKCERERA